MKMQIHGETLRISEVKELGAASSSDFRNQTRAVLTGAQKKIEVDLSQTTYLDSCGLGTLISLQKTNGGNGRVVRLLNPTPGIQQILELTRMNRIFEIVKN